MMVDGAARAAEQKKYEAAYAVSSYAMGAARMSDAVADLEALPSRGNYLDVGCGRGEMVATAQALGFSPVHGVEVVPELIDGTRVIFGQVHQLPFADFHFSVVTMFDVIEHLIPGDDESACREMARVTCNHILLTANNRPSHLKDGTDLHINKRPYEEWDSLFREWFPGRVKWIKGNRKYVSEGWRVDL